MAEVVASVLDNGVRVVLAPQPAMPVASVHLRMEVGSRHESPGFTGLAHLFEHLMFAATGHLASGDHLRMIENVGGYTNATTSVESTTYFETVPPEAVQLALWLEAERLANLPGAIDLDVLELQRDVVKNERREAVDNTPYGDAPELLAAAMYPAPHPYHHTPTGSMVDIDRVSLADAYQFFADHYVPMRTLVAVTGNVDTGAVADVIERQFGRLVPGGVPSPGTVDQSPAYSLSDSPADEHLRIQRRSTAPPNLIIGHRIAPAGTPECAAAELMAALLATGLASRLERRLKRERALAANVLFRVTPMIAGDSMAVARLRPRIDVDLAALEAGYLDELESLAVDGPSDEELDRARAQWVATWLSGTETPKTRAEELTWQWLAFGGPPVPGQARRRMESVTVDDLRRCALSLVESRRVTLSYVTD